MVYKNSIITNQSVVVIFDTNMIPIPRENPMYKQVVAAIKANKKDEIPGLVDMATKIRKYSGGKFYVVDGTVMIDGVSLPDALSKRLIAFADNGLPMESLLAFWDNLKQNPSERSREQLYSFLEHNGIPLTDDGCFVAYKRVDENYMDTYTHTIRNKPGDVVKMDRSKVNDDPNQTCSYGLHVAAYKYAHDFYPNGILMEVKVNPRDVVSVPVDYNNEKMRVCEYTVICECEKERAELLYNHNDPEWDDQTDTEDNDKADVDDTKDTKLEMIVDAKLTPDSQGRLCIPANLVREIGLTAGDYADVEIYNGEIIIKQYSNATNALDVRQYMVDGYSNIRLSPTVLKNASLNGTVLAEVIKDNDELTIRIS